jgi:hypothetical protein
MCPSITIYHKLRSGNWGETSPLGSLGEGEANTVARRGGEDITLLGEVSTIEEVEEHSGLLSAYM